LHLSTISYASFWPLALRHPVLSGYRTFAKKWLETPPANQFECAVYLIMWCFVRIL